MGNLSTTYLSIVNQALTMLGEDTIATFDVSSPSGSVQKVIANQLEPAVKRMLRRFNWRSAAVYLALGTDEASASVPDQSTFTISYDLPTGYLKMASRPAIDGFAYEADQEKPAYKIHGLKFLTNITGWEIQYIKFHALDDSGDGASVYSEELQFLMAAELAHKSCIGLTHDIALKNSIIQDREDAFIDATLSDFMEQAPSREAGILQSSAFNSRG